MHHLLCWCSRDCCTPWKCTNRAEMHHLLCWCSRDCCTSWKCTNRARTAPFTWLVQQRLLHPLEGTNRARTAPTELTIRGYVGGAWVWQGCHTLLQLLALMRFEPVLAPTGVSHERHVQRIGVLHLFDNNLFYTLLLLRQDGEVEFVVHLQNHL